MIRKGPNSTMTDVSDYIVDLQGVTFRRGQRVIFDGVDIRIPRGKVTGIIPEFLMDKEATRHSLGQLDELVVTADMHERKHLMFDRSDAFVALPGGIGTLEEIIEIMTWAQLGRHTKPIVLADVGNFWKPLESLIDHMKDQGFIHTAHLVQPLVISDPAQIVPAVQNLLAQAAPQDGDSAVIENL